MNMNEMILTAYRRDNKEQLFKLKEIVQSDLNELDLFFDEYLDLFSERMSSTEDLKDPVWKAYKNKVKEHEIATTNLKMIDYYLGMI